MVNSAALESTTNRNCAVGRPEDDFDARPTGARRERTL